MKYRDDTIYSTNQIIAYMRDNFIVGKNKSDQLNDMFMDKIYKKFYRNSFKDLDKFISKVGLERKKNIGSEYYGD